MYDSVDFAAFVVGSKASRLKLLFRNLFTIKEVSYIMHYYVDVQTGMVPIPSFERVLKNI